MIVENISDAIFIMDKNLKFTYVSPSDEKLRWFTVVEVMKKYLKDVLTPQSYEIALKVLEEELEKEK